MKTSPDEGQTPNGYTWPDIQLAEVAPRLGSAVTFRRDGRVLLVDDFQSLQWLRQTLSGSFSISHNFALNGYSSLKMTPPATPINNLVGIYRNFPVTYLTTMGFELSFYMPTVGVYNNLSVDLSVFSHNVNTRVGWRINFVANQAFYLNSGGGWTFALPLSLGSGNWVNVKMTGDYVGLTTNRMLVNGSGLTINAPAQSFATVAGEYFQMSVILDAVANVNVPIYLDNFILTTDEA